MTLPRVAVFALGGTIAMVEGDQGGVKPGLGAEELTAAVPELARVAEVRAETVSKLGSQSLTLASLYGLAERIQNDADAGVLDGAVVTQGTNTIEETAFLLDCLLDVGVPVVVTGAMRHPLMVSSDGPGNVLAAVRVATSARVRERARELGVLVVMLDNVHAAVEVQKLNTHRIDAFASPATGPLGALIEGRVFLDSLPLRAYKRSLGAAVGRAPAGRLKDASAPVALLHLGLGETGGLLSAMAKDANRLGYRGLVLGLMGGGHAPGQLEDAIGAVAAAVPTVGAARSAFGALLKHTYEFAGGEIALKRLGVIGAGRLHALKARLLLDLLLRAGLDRAAVAEVFASFD